MKMIKKFKGTKLTNPLNKLENTIKHVKKMNKTIQYLQMVKDAVKKTQREPWRWKSSEREQEQNKRKPKKENSQQNKNNGRVDLRYL